MQNVFSYFLQRELMFPQLILCLYISSVQIVCCVLCAAVILCVSVHSTACFSQ